MHTHCAGDTEAAAAAAAVAAADAADMPADAADMFRAAAVYLRAVRDEDMHFAVYADAATKYFRSTAAQQAPDDIRRHADELFRRCLDKMCRLSNTVRAAREMIGAHSHFHCHSILLEYQVEL